MKFCCDKFMVLYQMEKQFGLNIRIIKLSDQFVARGDLNFNKSFLVTEGYPGSIVECKKTMTLNFCPFCGVQLNKYYKDDRYAQEIVTIS
jgi:hypothetical protein